jgi:hypothetical protein
LSETEQRRLVLDWGRKQESFPVSPAAIESTPELPGDVEEGLL